MKTRDLDPESAEKWAFLWLDMIVIDNDMWLAWQFTHPHLRSHLAVDAARLAGLNADTLARIIAAEDTEAVPPKFLAAVRKLLLRPLPDAALRQEWRIPQPPKKIRRDNCETVVVVETGALVGKWGNPHLRALQLDMRCVAPGTWQVFAFRRGWPRLSS